MEPEDFRVLQDPGVTLTDVGNSYMALDEAMVTEADMVLTY
jgi:hypothetical protein